MVLRGWVNVECTWLFKYCRRVESCSNISYLVKYSPVQLIVMVCRDSFICPFLYYKEYMSKFLSKILSNSWESETNWDERRVFTDNSIIWVDWESVPVRSNRIGRWLQCAFHVNWVAAHGIVWWHMHRWKGWHRSKKGWRRCLPLFCSHERQRGEGTFFMVRVCFSHLLERDRRTHASNFNG